MRPCIIVSRERSSARALSLEVFKTSCEREAASTLERWRAEDPDPTTRYATMRFRDDVSVREYARYGDRFMLMPVASTNQ